MKNICSILFAMLLFAGCGDVPENEPKSSALNSEHNLRLNGAFLSPTALSNIQVYAFNGAGSSAFSHRVYTMSQTGNILSMVVPADTWDFVLLSAESGSLGQPHVPTVGSQRASAKMWTCPDDGVQLHPVPEIITARTGAVQINPGAHEQLDASLVRNVAQVSVKINDVSGLRTNGNHTISLLDVPRSLTWDGGLYPSKTNPDVSLLPLTLSATFHDSQDTQYSDEVVFLVPAHQGVDFLEDAEGFPKDTTTHKLRIAVDLELSDGSRLQKSAELPVVPKANRRLAVSVRVGSSLNVSASIHDWVDHALDADLSHTTLAVSKTSVGLSSRDTVFVQTNALSGYTIASEVPWLTVAKDGNRIYLQANTESYFTDGGEPRTGYLAVKANNLIKRIKVTQRPDVGTITHSLSNPPSSFWVSPTSGNASRDVNVTSTGEWALIFPDPYTVTTAGVTGGPAGTTSVEFKRKVHMGEITDYENYYGTSVFKLRNKESLEEITFTADNLYLEAPEQINVQGSGGTSFNEDIISMGLSGEYVIIGVTYNATGTDWLDVSIEDGRFKTTAAREPDENLRWCTVTIAHQDDLNYTQSIRVEQNPFYDIIDPFTYLVGKFEWNSYSTDMDIAVLIYDDHGKSILPAGMHIGYKDGGTGYSNNADIIYKDKVIARYGGDPASRATAANNGEAFVIYMNAFDDTDHFKLDELDRYINIYMYAWWWSGVPTDGTVTLAIQYWLDGTIMPVQVTSSSPYAYIYTNPTGTNQNPDPNPKTVSPIKARGSVAATTVNIINHSTGMTKVARVRYDRLTHKANIVWYVSTDLANWPTTNVALPQSAPLMLQPMNYNPKES